MSVRIIAGKYKGRTIEVPSSARPTLARFRQTLFDVLESFQNDFFQNAVVMDCFAGTGALGIEALSRGAQHVFFIDKDRSAVATLRANIEKLHIAENVTVICEDIMKIRNPKQQKCNVVFLDPPYGKVSIAKTVERLTQTDWLAENAFLITEEDKNNAEDLSFLHLIASKQLGISLFRVFAT